MPATDLPYTYIAKRKYWRFRHPKTGDVKLPGKPGDPAFHARYSELVATVERETAPVPKSSFKWLIDQYRSSEEFKALATPEILQRFEKNGLEVATSTPQGATQDRSCA